MNEYIQQKVPIQIDLHQKEILSHITGSCEVCEDLRRKLGFPVILLGRLLHQADNNVVAKVLGQGLLGGSVG